MIFFIFSDGMKNKKILLIFTDSMNNKLFQKSIHCMMMNCNLNFGGIFCKISRTFVHISFIFIVNFSENLFSVTQLCFYFFQRFCLQAFDTNYKATIGVDFEAEKFFILGVPYILQLWVYYLKIVKYLTWNEIIILFTNQFDFILIINNFNHFLNWKCYI